MPPTPTIARLLTPPGKGGIAVIHLSGERTAEILGGLFVPLQSHAEEGDGRLQLGRLVADGRMLDEAIVQRQGEEAEINIHGGPTVARSVLEALLSRGATIASDSDAPCGRLGEPISLPAAHPQWNNPAIGRELMEALPSAASATVVSALTLQWSAGISKLAREALTTIESECRASLPDLQEMRGGAPVPPRSPQVTCPIHAAGQEPRRADIQALHAQLSHAAAGLAVMRRILAPAEVVLAGPPNAGKSTLANALVGRPVSIVHETPGTTRDWVRELALIAGLPVWITDTAGVLGGEGILPLRPEGVPPLGVAGVSPARSTGILPVSSTAFQAVPSVSSSSSSSSFFSSSSSAQADIDRESSRRAIDRISRADVVLMLGQPPAATAPLSGGRPKVIRIWTKADACPPPPDEMWTDPRGGAPVPPRSRSVRTPVSAEIGDCPYFPISARTGEGIDRLNLAILRAIGLADFDPSIPRAFTPRQADMLSAAADAIERDDLTRAATGLRRMLEGT